MPRPTPSRGPVASSSTSCTDIGRPRFLRRGIGRGAAPCRASGCSSTRPFCRCGSSRPATPMCRWMTRHPSSPRCGKRSWETRSMLRVLTAGESHGPELVAIMEGLPSGVPISRAAIQADLARRKLGYGRGSRMKFEEDELSISSGVRHGFSLGSPIALRIGNTEWPKWVEVMSAEPVELTEKSRGRGAALTRPRPGHADLVGMQKYDFDEARPILERASARETAARVALGALARGFLAEAYGVEILSHVVELGPIRTPAGLLPTYADLSAIDDDPLRCFDPRTAAAMLAEVEDCQKSGDTLGGVVEVVAWGVPPGLGSHVTGDRRLDAR